MLVSKNTEVLDNIDIAKKNANAMLDEFLIAHHLDHPNVVKYKYFIREYDETTKRHEFHNIIELV